MLRPASFAISAENILVNSAGTRSNICFSHARSGTPERAHSQSMNTESGAIDVILSPPEIDLLPQRDLTGTVAVVFDVLRATSTMITALSNGAAGIWPVRTIEEAWTLKQQRPDALLGGERHGERIEGFDLAIPLSSTARTSGGGRLSAPPPTGPLLCGQSSTHLPYSRVRF